MLPGLWSSNTRIWFVAAIYCFELLQPLYVVLCYKTFNLIWILSVILWVCSSREGIWTVFIGVLVYINMWIAFGMDGCKWTHRSIFMLNMFAWWLQLSVQIPRLTQSQSLVQFGNCLLLYQASLLWFRKWLSVFLRLLECRDGIFWEELTMKYNWFLCFFALCYLYVYYVLIVFLHVSVILLKCRLLVLIVVVVVEMIDNWWLIEDVHFVKN